MRLKGLSIKELKTLENKLKNDIAQTEKSIVAQKNRLKKLRNEVGQVRSRRTQLEYKERLREDFIEVVIQ
jgi:septal ring factor EnvC (AmiA/AmiB activator)